LFCKHVRSTAFLHFSKLTEQQSLKAVLMDHASSTQPCDVWLRYWLSIAHGSCQKSYRSHVMMVNERQITMIKS